MTATYIAVAGILVVALLFFRRLLALNRSKQSLRTKSSGLTKTEAEDWLDWLEANGYPQGELTHVDGKGFAIRQV